MRTLASIVKISNSIKHPNADSLSIASVKGWKVVTGLNQFEINDLAVYFEIDSWIPNSLFPLSKNEPKTYNGIKGEKLRTIKIRNVLSQGLLLPISIINDPSLVFEGNDVTEYLGIQKWEKSIPPELSGIMKNDFPSFIQKTDAERVQNLFIEYNDWKNQKIEFEVSEKLDGSSFTCYYHNGNFGVCSRNLELLKDNSNYWKAAILYELEQKLVSLNKNIAIQGELIGEKIQGNRYNISGIDLYVFNIFDINQQIYLNPNERIELINFLGLKSVPIIGTIILQDDVDWILNYAEGKSILNNKIEREGIVLKSSSCQFKAISNKFLIKS